MLVDFLIDVGNVVNLWGWQAIKFWVDVNRLRFYSHYSSGRSHTNTNVPECCKENSGKAWNYNSVCCWVFLPQICEVACPLSTQLVFWVVATCYDQRCCANVKLNMSKFVVSCKGTFWGPKNVIFWHDFCQNVNLGQFWAGLRKFWPKTGLSIEDFVCLRTIYEHPHLWKLDVE